MEDYQKVLLLLVCSIIVLIIDRIRSAYKNRNVKANIFLYRSEGDDIETTFTYYENGVAKKKFIGIGKEEEAIEFYESRKSALSNVRFKPNQIILQDKILKSQTNETRTN